MVDQLTEEQIAELKEAFQLLDTDNDGNIPINALGTVVRSLGQNPTPNELQDMINEVDGSGSGQMSLSNFLEFMARRWTQQDTVEDIAEPFRRFDTSGTGFITAAETRDVLSALGERLTDDEVSEMVRDAPVNAQGLVAYDVLIEMLLRNSAKPPFTQFNSDGNPVRPLA